MKIKRLLALNLACAALAVAGTAQADIPSPERMNAIIVAAAGVDSSLAEQTRSAQVAFREKRAFRKEELNAQLLQEIKRGNSDEAKFLLRKGADAFAKTDDGTTALMLAAAKGDVDLARILIERHAFVDSYNDAGETALSHSVDGEMVRFLFRHGARAGLDVARPFVNGTKVSRLYYAIDVMEDEDMAMAWLEAGADPNLDTPGEYNIPTNPLLKAAEVGSLNLVKALVAHHAEVGSTDFYGGNAVWHAAGSRHADALAKIRYFEGKGLALDQPGTDGRTPLFNAVDALNVEAVEYLLSHKANVNAVAKLGGDTTPVMKMAWNCDDAIRPDDKKRFISILNTMINVYHADVNYKNRDGGTALRGVVYNLSHFPSADNVCKDMLAILKNAGARQ